MTFCPEWGGREHALVVWSTVIADGDMINVKRPVFSTTIRVYIPCKIPYNADDIVY
jgi:hypothetical protein